MALSKAQEQAIMHYTGPAIVLAGPGSGKTTVITRRAATLVQHYHVPSEHILVVTFTRAAAEEMKTRFLALTGEQKTQIRFGTFHSVFFQILKAAYHFTAANIVSEDKKYTILREILHSLNLENDDEKELLKSISSEIGNIKTERINLAHYYSVSVSDETFRSIYQMYEKRMEEEHLIDYDDIILFTWELLRQRKDILKILQDKYQYILIDEFQDINKLQYDIIQMIAAPRNNLFIVGDDDQSIYRFRGAKPEIMLNFPKDYPGAREILLDLNFRCPGAVVSLASSVIERNTTRFQKEITAAKENGHPVRFLYYQNQSQESMGIIQFIQKYRQKGYAYSDMAILYRNNQDARIISQRFLEYNIPILMKDAIPNLYEHWIAQNVIDYLQAALGSRDRSIFLRIMNKPKRYLSRESLNLSQVSFTEIRRYYSDKAWMCSRIDTFESDLHQLSLRNPYDAIEYLRHQIGYDSYLEEYSEYRKIPLEDLMEILDQVQESAKGFSTIMDWFSHILEYTEMLKEQGRKKEETYDAITFSTLHSSKGLEYKIVFLIDVNDGIIPYKKARMTADLEEERRMFYVGITRAKELLHICSIKEKNGKELAPSPFLKDL